ncbi:MAG TPA: hypothetical protein PLL66_02360 [Bacteroidales bacterium]|mgnify:CR=1 FL=1|nr:hypothetical protein [Bacteroidales bacterium]
MKLYINLFILILSLIFIGDNLIAQRIYFNYKDSTLVSNDRLELTGCIYNQDLLQHVWDQDSVAIWVLEQDSCQTCIFSGIPWCDNCSLAANFVLQNAYKLSFIDNKVIMGSCWDYLNAVYSPIEAEGYKKNEIYMTKKAGPFAPKAMLQPGDWIYHINYQYYQVEHSAIFICWKDYEKGIAITLSYMGMNRYKTAQFGEFDLNSVYAIYRFEDLFW